MHERGKRQREKGDKNGAGSRLRINPTICGYFPGAALKMRPTSFAMHLPAPKTSRGIARNVRSCASRASSHFRTARAAERCSAARASNFGKTPTGSIPLSTRYPAAPSSKMCDVCSARRCAARASISLPESEIRGCDRSRARSASRTAVGR